MTRPSAAPSLPLSALLATTAVALQAVRLGQSTAGALAAVPAVQRPGVQALLFQVLRNLGRAQALRGALVARTPAPLVDALLCCALALLWRPQHAPYAPFTLVNQAVEAAKRHAATLAHSRFINACLRRFLRESAALLQATDDDVVARWNHPAWWIARVRHDHPQHWQAILEAADRPPPMTLRVALNHTTPAQYCQWLAESAIEARPVGNTGVVLQRPLPVAQLPGFAQGVVSVQDAAAQRAASLLLQGLPVQQSLRVLDACAAPGGKTAHVLETVQALGMDCHVTALDVDAVRVARIHDTLQRVRLSADVCVGDAAVPATWWDGRLFDAILLDAPCTASGIVRRHPDVRWLRRASDVAQLAAQQKRLLAALWPLLKDGGRLLYCTCSVFHAEGQGQMQAFLADNSDAQLLPSPGHLLPSCTHAEGVGADNSAGEYDGFFYALVQKNSCSP